MRVIALALISWFGDGRHVGHELESSEWRVSDAPTDQDFKLSKDENLWVKEEM